MHRNGATNHNFPSFPNDFLPRESEDELHVGVLGGVIDKVVDDVDRVHHRGDEFLDQSLLLSGTGGKIIGGRVTAGGGCGLRCGLFSRLDL